MLTTEAEHKGQSPTSVLAEAETSTSTLKNPNNLKLESFKRQFSKDGFLLSKQIIPKDDLEQWRQFANTYFHQCFERLHAYGHIKAPTDIIANTTNATCGNSTDGSQRKYTMGLGVKCGFREIVMRSPGRYELSLLECEDCPPIDIINDRLFPLVPNLLGATRWEELKVCHLSLVISTPNSPEQSWHADGGHVSVSEHLPCHAANVFIPLRNVPLELGPTEFRPGTQVYTRNLAPMMLAARARKQLRPPVTPELELGDALCFDYRVLHRGRANRSMDYRAILVITYSQPWYNDVCNFPARSMTDSPTDSS